MSVEMHREHPPEEPVCPDGPVPMDNYGGQVTDPVPAADAPATELAEMQASEQSNETEEAEKAEALIALYNKVSGRFTPSRHCLLRFMFDHTAELMAPKDLQVLFEGQGRTLGGMQSEITAFLRQFEEDPDLGDLLQRGGNGIRRYICFGGKGDEVGKQLEVDKRLAHEAQKRRQREWKAAKAAELARSAGRTIARRGVSISKPAGEPAQVPADSPNPGTPDDTEVTASSRAASRHSRRKTIGRTGEDKDQNRQLQESAPAKHDEDIVWREARSKQSGPGRASEAIISLWQEVKFAGNEIGQIQRDDQRGERVRSGWGITVSSDEDDPDVRLLFIDGDRCNVDTITVEIIELISEVRSSLTPGDIRKGLLEFLNEPVGYKGIIDRLDVLGQIFAQYSKTGWRDLMIKNDQGQEIRAVSLDEPPSK